MSSSDSKVKVSVCVVTYNQEKFISKCLQSLIEQKTNFNFEIIVGDDASTDKTKKIVEGISAKYPEIVFLNSHESNVGAVRNMISTYKVAKGKYICHFDGDDYALPGKLQKQFDALESNPDCSICTHSACVVDSTGSVLNKNWKKYKQGKHSLTDLLQELPFFINSSKMFRNDLDLNYWQNFTSDTLDFEVHVEQAKRGNIYHIESVLGAYRFATGISTASKKMNPIFFSATDRLYRKLLKEAILDKKKLCYFFARIKFKQAYQAAVLGDSYAMIRCIKDSIALDAFSKKQKVFNFLSKVPFILIFFCKLRSFVKGYGYGSR